ncbi:helix-turn-helix transcriptional regulator [uncultured Pseudokineococcus sp.]|uniref:helix-turn-helix transcriptional regulator n=1 Tax=uncultured Pseudokineococcus sp. TaxID=1642928 RepID=UPI00341DE263
MHVDRSALGDFLRARREALSPEDVGLVARPRRRTPGLRREDVAELCAMSVDYVARLERGDGPRPSPQMAAALARGLRLTLEERDHLFLLCGHRPAARELRGEHVGPGLLRVLDRLGDTPAQVIGAAGETLLQTPAAVALLGEQTQYDGLARSAPYRWFTDPAERARYLPDDHEHNGRVQVSQLRAAALVGARSRAAHVVAELRQRSPEFAGYWDRHEVGLRWSDAKRFLHPQLGRLQLHCQTLLDPDQSQSLLVFTATPGTEDAEKLALLAVLGTDSFPVG